MYNPNCYYADIFDYGVDAANAMSVGDADWQSKIRKDNDYIINDVWWNTPHSTDDE